MDEVAVSWEDEAENEVIESWEDHAEEPVEKAKEPFVANKTKEEVPVEKKKDSDVLKPTLIVAEKVPSYFTKLIV